MGCSLCRYLWYFILYSFIALEFKKMNKLEKENELDKEEVENKIETQNN